MTIDYTQVKAWPFEEARKLLKRVGGKTPAKGYVLFETGYGPSGLPHLGTFCEVIRPLFVKQAFEAMSDIPTKLIMVSDDMDGLRKVPSNVPNQELLKENLKKPLTAVPDPFETDPSFGEHNNRRVREFLDSYNIEYEFYSASELYKSGKKNAALHAIMDNYDAVQNIMLPTLGDARRETYSPFLPRDPETDHMLEVSVKIDPAAKTITYTNELGNEHTTPVGDGNCKLQWKPDWATHWFTFDTDYEMAGKEHIHSIFVSDRIIRALGKEPPLHMVYELFLDEEGGKISKSKGNGVNIEDWQKYANQEALTLFIYNKPTTQKKLYLGIIPKMVDEYFDLRAKYHTLSPQEQLESPVWHIHSGNVPTSTLPFTYAMLLNLISTSPSIPTKEYVWGVIKRYRPDVTTEAYPDLDNLIEKGVNYFTDIVATTRSFLVPNAEQREWLQDLHDTIGGFAADMSPEDMQTEIYTVGKRYFDKSELRNWFKFIYNSLFGFDDGPRMGGFIQIYGIADTQELIQTAMKRAAAQAA